MSKAILSNIRITGDNKTYIMGQLEQYAERVVDDSEGYLSHLEFGKQDLRGGISITAYSVDHCVPEQRFFNSKDEMIGYVVGVNHVHNGGAGYSYV